jgi:opacity protein-like surface antigen
MRRYVLPAALVFLLLPGVARADWLFTPTLGATFGADTSGNEHLTYGASIGWMGAGVFGFEGDFSFTPEFFEGDDDDFDLDGGSNVVTAMFNTVIGIPFGGQEGGGFRPYVTAGAGMLQTEARSTDDLFRVDNSEFGINVGGGTIIFFGDNVGLRTDLRYFRSLEDPDEDNEFDVAVGNFDYWRGTAGLTFRW